MKTHFFTGFPGFITAQLIKDLIKKGQAKKIYTLVQDSQMELAKNRAAAINVELKTDINIEVICGDITLPNLGIDPGILAKLENESLVFWHLAAMYDLAVKEEIAWKVNVDGTKMVSDFVKRHPSIERLMYFSTAYVAGTREGKLLETELIRPKAFKNHYEETKYESELIVEQLKEIIPVTIIRPGIVRGHSETGETIKFDGPYFFINLIERLKWLPFIPYIGKSNAELNVVPIDYIIEASIYLSSHEKAVGATVHLTDPSPHSIENVYRAMVIELTGKEPKGRVPKSLAKIGLSFKFLRQKLGVEAETLDYLTWNATFDITVADQLLTNSNIECADFITSIPMMVYFYNGHKDNVNYHVKIE